MQKKTQTDLNSKFRWYNKYIGKWNKNLSKLFDYCDNIQSNEKEELVKEAKTLGLISFK